MPSLAYRRWISQRASALDEIAQAHVAVGGTRRGRRHTTQQINQAYAVLLASQFQGFCRDLHAECVDHFVKTMALSLDMEVVVRAEFTRGRQLASGNARPASIGADFGRLGISFWPAVEHYDAAHETRKGLLDSLNDWRNAVAHQDFDPGKLGGMTLRLAHVRQWRKACRRLARTFDEVMRHHLHWLTGTSPW